MPTASDARRRQILALQPRLLDCAGTLTRDADEAEALVHETMTLARCAEEASGGEAWVFRLLRQRFYSVERDREYRRSRSAAVSELRYARKREVQAEAAAEASNGQ